MIIASIPAALVSLPTTGAKVISGKVIPVTKKVSEFCKVIAEIVPVDPKAPKIMLHVALPIRWNMKAVMFGGGSLNGSVPNVAKNVPAGPFNKPKPLGRGYAIFASITQFDYISDVYL